MDDLTGASLLRTRRVAKLVETSETFLPGTIRSVPRPSSAPVLPVPGAGTVSSANRGADRRRPGAILRAAERLVLAKAVEDAVGDHDNDRLDRSKPTRTGVRNDASATIFERALFGKTTRGNVQNWWNELDFETLGGGDAATRLESIQLCMWDARDDLLSSMPDDEGPLPQNVPLAFLDLDGGGARGPRKVLSRRDSTGEADAERAAAAAVGDFYGGGGRERIHGMETDLTLLTAHQPPRRDSKLTIESSVDTVASLRRELESLRLVVGAASKPKSFSESEMNGPYFRALERVGGNLSRVEDAFSKRVGACLARAERALERLEAKASSATKRDASRGWRSGAGADKGKSPAARGDEAFTSPERLLEEHRDDEENRDDAPGRDDALESKAPGKGLFKFNSQSQKTQPLRDFLVDRFDHPYPTDREREQLAKRTGMTRTQVGNWFINARVRIWRPMILRLGEQIEREGAAARRKKPKQRTPKK